MNPASNRPSPLTRRRFAGHLAGVAGGVMFLPQSLRPRQFRGGDKLNLGIIGVSGRGRPNRKGVEGENIVAVCDVDRRYLDEAKKAYPGSEAYQDYRELFRRRDLDAVVISTPDHTHAPAAAMALRRGLDVYCEKPLTHTVHETRMLTKMARERRAITQMGIQIHAQPNFRRVVELLQSGAVGELSAVHVFVNGTDWSAKAFPEASSEVPGWLDWDLWLGPAVERAYHPKAYHPVQWRRFWEFGGGTTGDMGCHYMDLAFWGAGLTAPTSIQSTAAAADASGPPRGLVTKYRFPATEERQAVDLTWYGGKARPPIFSETVLGNDAAEVEAVSKRWRNGVLFCGSKGYLMSGYTKHELLPAGKFVSFVPPKPTLPDSVGHHREWIEACRSREATSCGFDYSGPLTEAVLLANVSHRLGGKKLDWDAKSATVTNAPEAAELLTKEYRAGFGPEAW